MPRVIRSDNGSAFVSQLFEAMQKMIGFRHIRVLPYSARSNGIAEKAVGRVASVLIKHCHILANWHKALPLVTYALNSSIHAGIERSPFSALFGRAPVGIPELEDPQLEPLTSTGSEFMDELRDRLISAWQTIRDTSQAIKIDNIRRMEKNRKRYLSLADPSAPGGIHKGDFILLRHGSYDHAKARRKHGYPALRRFEVLDLLPEAQAVRIDPRNTGISDVVALRHCVKAPDSYWIFDDGSPRSGVSDGLPPSLVVARGNPNEAGGRPVHEDGADNADPDVFVVDCILEARFQRRKKRWEYLVKWQNSPDVTWETAAQLSDAGQTVRAQMDSARAQAEEQSTAARAASRNRDSTPQEKSTRSTDDGLVDLDEGLTDPSLENRPTYDERPSTRRAPTQRYRALVASLDSRPFATAQQLGRSLFR